MNILIITMIIMGFVSKAGYGSNGNLASGFILALVTFVALSRWLLESIFVIIARGTFMHICAGVYVVILAYIR